jgi:hypothetical protein
MPKEMPQFGGPEFSEEQMAAMDKETKDAMEGAPTGGQGQEFAPNLKDIPSIPLKKEAQMELNRERRAQRGDTASPEEVAKHEAWKKEMEEVKKKYGKAA